MAFVTSLPCVHKIPTRLFYTVCPVVEYVLVGSCVSLLYSDALLITRSKRYRLFISLWMDGLLL